MSGRTTSLIFVISTILGSLASLAFARANDFDIDMCVMRAILGGMVALGTAINVVTASEENI